ncbi:MAG: alpha/beta hydrolase [Pyrinomonadaceae bacterium]
MTHPIKRYSLGIVMAIFGICALATAQELEVEPQTTTLEGAVTHVYKTIGGAELRLHVFPPSKKKSSRVPAIIFFFGGGWTMGDVAQFEEQSKYLAKRGMVAIVADYRVFGRHKTGPFEAIADAKSAIRWTRSHAKALGIDPKRIAAAGGSSGGSVALSTAIFDGFDEKDEDKSVSSKPNALILFNPAVDTTRNSPRLLSERFRGLGSEGSPLQHLHRGLPPTVVFHGKSDTTVPYADAERFCRESTKLGNTCDLFGYEGAEHGFFNPGRAEGKWYRKTVLEMDRFLTRIGYLSKAAVAPSPTAASSPTAIPSSRITKSK